MNYILKVCGVALVGLFSSLLLKKNGGSMYIAVAVCAFLTVAVFSFDNSLIPVVDEMKNITELSEGLWETVLKALGIGFITSFVAEICTSAGEETLSSAVLFAGKAELLLLCLPMARKLLSIAEGAL